MKNKILIIVFLTSISINSFSQKLEKIKGNKIIATQEYPIDDFKKLVVGETFNVVLQIGVVPHISITTDSNIHSAIEHVVFEDVLTLHYNKRISTRKKPIITITFTENLNSIELNDKAELNMISEIKTKDFSLVCSKNSKGTLLITCDDFSFNANEKSEINLNLNSKSATLLLSNSSELVGNIKTKSIKIKQSNRTDLKIKGKAEKLDLTIANKSDFNGIHFNSNETTLTAKDYSNVKLKTSSKLILDVRDNSEIYIYGSPKIIVNDFKNSATLYKR